MLESANLEQKYKLLSQSLLPPIPNSSTPPSHLQNQVQGLEPRNITILVTRLRLFYVARLATPKLWWAGQGRRKVRLLSVTLVVPISFNPSL